MPKKKQTGGSFDITHGWGDIKPRSTAERKKLIQNCKKGCFLIPEKLKFPICRRCKGDVCTCRPDCLGLRAAKIRAAQWHYPKVYAAADEMIKRYNCQYKRKTKK